MNTAELTDLETQIDNLLESLNRLKQDNLALRNQLAVSAHERSQLQERNHEAAEKIKTIISQLKDALS